MCCRMGSVSQPGQLQPGRTIASETGRPGLNRREFLATGSAASVLTVSGLGIVQSPPAAGREFPRLRKPLRMQPVLVYSLYEHRDRTSWRPWGGLHSENDVADERRRIQTELAHLGSQADFPLEILPLVAAQNAEDTAAIQHGNYDVMLMYAAGGDVRTLEALSRPNGWNLVFLRHRSGPVYLWYEIVSNRFLRKTVDEFGQPGVGVRDVVVDDTGELTWRLRALAALHNTLGKRILCIGGASGWGEGGRTAPERTRQTFSMELVDVSYPELAERLEAAWTRPELVAQAEAEARRYLEDTAVSLQTGREYVDRAFLLTRVFEDLMAEAGTDAITINHCMGTIMEVARTTACLPLSVLNDRGRLAFCESDFVVIPAGILLHYVSGKPVFFNDPTFAHDGLVTLAHCTAPRRMDGVRTEPAHLLTHFESDWGVAPKVEMRIGQEVTVVDPDFNFERWLGFKGEISGNPFLDICRSQIDVSFTCDTDRLNEETRGFHWMACYGDYLREMEYAARKSGLEWLTLS